MSFTSKQSVEIVFTVIVISRYIPATGIVIVIVTVIVFIVVFDSHLPTLSRVRPFAQGRQERVEARLDLLGSVAFAFSTAL